MGKRRHPVNVIEIQKVDIGPLGQPVDAVLKIRLEGARKAYVFTMTQTARRAMEDEYFVKAAQSLGDLVNPYQATIIVMPDEAPDLRVYEVVAK